MRDKPRSSETASTAASSPGTTGRAISDGAGTVWVLPMFTVAPYMTFCAQDARFTAGNTLFSIRYHEETLAGCNFFPFSRMRLRQAILMPVKRPH
jgi:hypothetical protein